MAMKRRGNRKEPLSKARKIVVKVGPQEDHQIKGKITKRKIGLFGGTFNPIHIGHLRGAEEIREAFSLEKVVFVPAATPPHKDAEKIVDPDHRLKMVRLGTRTNPAFSTSEIELRRPGKSYSIDTIRYFQRNQGTSLFFILGRDAFGEIETWKDYEQLFFLCNFIVMARPGFEETSSSAPLPPRLTSVFRYSPEGGSWIHVSGHTLHFRAITFLDISSTRVRELIGRKESVRYLLPREVETYIRRHGLYQSRKGPSSSRRSM